MTNQEKQQLSRDVAAKYWIVPNTGMEYCDEKAKPLGVYSGGKWLHEDSARCFDLFAEHEIDIKNYGNWVMAVSDTGDYREYTKDHDNDKAMTARIAGLKALLAKGE